MRHTYKITGMTCGGCAAKVKSELLKHPEVLSAEVSLDPPQAIVDMQDHIPLSELQQQVSNGGNYRIMTQNGTDEQVMVEEAKKTGFLQTYKPLILIFLFITGVSFISAFPAGQFSPMLWMNHFMGGFFITFAFFKFLDLKGFADSYSMYDLLARRFYNYGYIYPFLELALGVAYLTMFNPVITNISTIVIMGFSAIGVIKSVVDKRQIKCACLGTVFNLPMTYVTIVEDLLMVVMAAVMLVWIG